MSSNWSRPVRSAGPTPIGAQDPAQMPQLTQRSALTRATTSARPSVRSSMRMAS